MSTASPGISVFASRLPKRVLLIDDEQRITASLGRLLRSRGYEVELANSGTEGIAKLQRSEFPVVVTDLRMGDGDGFEVMQKMSSRTSMAFIVITGHATTETAIEALQLKAFDFLQKPFEFELLLRSVERAFVALDAQAFREDMISMITHDIKIPLSSIIGYSTMAINRQTGELHPKAAEFVQTINANGVKILSLIDNFLTSARIESGKLQLFARTVNLASLVEDGLSVFQADIARNGLEVHVELAPGGELIIQGDESLLSRAVNNLLSNAVKYTPEGKRVWVRAGAAQRPGWVQLVVENEGPGIPPDQLSSVFRMYARTRAHGGVEGSGIGAHVLRSVIEAHGGQVAVASEVNRLTRFTVTLPIDGLSASPQEETE